MNNMIKIFESKEFGKVRTVVRNGETWWILKDICRVLEMKAKREDTRLKLMAILNKADSESRFLTDEEKTEIDKFEAEIRSWDDSITRMEKALA